MLLAHSVVLKLMTYTPARALPGSLAYATFALEAVGGAMLGFGIQTRWVALALSPILIGAVLFVHGDKGSRRHWR
jgi:putative oxidoreductase